MSGKQIPEEPWRKGWEATQATWLRGYLKRINVQNSLHFGSGSGEIFAFTFPTLMRLAQLEGRPTYPINLGNCEAEKFGALSKLGSLIGDATAFPEQVELLLTWRSIDAAGVEVRLRRELSALGRSLESGPGSGWIQSNVDELIALLEKSTGIAAAEIRYDRNYEWWNVPSL